MLVYVIPLPLLLFFPNETLADFTTIFSFHFWYYTLSIYRDWIQFDTEWARYVKLRVAHAPGMPGWFSPPPQVRDPDMHHGTCVTHVPWCMPGSLICIFLWSWWRGKRSRHSRRMRNPQVYVSGKRSIQYERKRAQICSDYELTKHELWGVFGVLWRNDNAWYPDRTVECSTSPNRMTYLYLAPLWCDCITIPKWITGTYRSITL